MALDGKNAEVGAILGDGTEFLEFCRFLSGLHLVHAWPHLYRDTSLGRVTLKRRNLLPGGEEPAAHRFDQCLRFRSVVFGVGVYVFHAANSDKTIV
jgi:hypothetical protein